MSVLAAHPGTWRALHRLGVLLVETGRPSAARLVFEEEIRRHPEDAAARTNLAHLLLEAGDREASRSQYLTALSLAPDLRAAHEGLAALLSDLGEEELADAHRTPAFREAPTRTLPYRGAAPPLEVLVLASSRGGNVRYRSLLKAGPFALTVLAVDFWDPRAPLPTHDVVLNAIGDADRAGESLERARVLLGNSQAAVVNAPEAVRGRMAVMERASRIPGVRVPRMLALPRAVLAGSGSGERLFEGGLGFPLLLRSPGFHTGRHLVRVESPEELRQAFGRLPGTTLWAIQFLDARGPDGLYRKFRVMSVGGKLLPGHLAASHDWNVHYVTSLTPGRPDLEAEEVRFLEEMDAVLGPRATAALRHLSEAFRLDYVGFDFALDEQGALVLFEANPVMLVLEPPRDARYYDARLHASRAVGARLSVLISEAGSGFSGRLA